MELLDIVTELSRILSIEGISLDTPVDEVLDKLTEIAMEEL